MSKITFRADDELIKQLEEYDASKSEVMRRALREFLGDGGARRDVNTADPESLDELVAERVDAIIAERLNGAFTRRAPQDINVNITLDGDSADVSHTTPGDRKTADGEDVDASDAERKTEETERKTCKQCGEILSPSHVYCPNCGEKASHRVFCECGDELRSDWAFCPSCGRRTPAADVLDNP